MFQYSLSVQFTFFLGEGRWPASLSSCIARSVVRICFRFDHWNCKAECDSVNLHVVHLHINKNNNIAVLCWVVFAVLRNVFLIHRTYFVISVMNLPQSRREKPLLLQWRRRMNYTVVVKLGNRARAGHHSHVAVDVRNIYVAGLLALTNQCLSQSLWCGYNTRIILLIDTFV
jgi:hypothetical protein